MTRLMYDAIYPDKAPKDGQIYAGYIDGNPNWRSYNYFKKLYPQALVVSISVTGALSANVYDVESGNLLPQDVVPILKRERAAGNNPTIYCNLSNHDTIISDILAAGLSQPPYWIAHYTEQSHFEPGSVATQWGSESGYDVSTVADFWPGVDAQPTQPTTVVIGDINMNLQKSLITISLDANGNGWDLADGRDNYHPAVAWTSFFGSFPNGADPRVLHGYMPGPAVGSDQSGSFVQIEVTGGPKSGTVGIWLVYATA